MKIIKKIILKFTYLLNNLLPKIKLDLASFLNDIKHINYCIIKYESPSIPTDFPQSYKVGSDVDIIVENNDFTKMYKYVYHHFKKNKMMYFYNCKISNNSEFIKVRIERFGILHFLIEIFINHRQISNKSVNKMLETKIVEKSFYISHKKYEILVRLVEAIEYPHKNHHFEYIIENKAFIDFDLLKSEKLLESYYQLFK